MIRRNMSKYLHSTNIYTTFKKDKMLDKMCIVKLRLKQNFDFFSKLFSPMKINKLICFFITPQ